ncbi:uncharacterized protein LOC21397802 isoform X3 [Morus notabilis]|uniref:uncharacterized protein LOC21397802 isoform X3 n=1 Tax=Morus notabilis TaxID=981085 RepID=UPI000CED4F7E|nr:uncharacterized protein LOC21397802 isoform X3 [Morus notabilis]
MIPPNSAFHPIEFSLSLFVTLNSSLSKIVLQLSQALSGKARRKKLLSPKGIDVRPIMEVVKGAAFGILQAIKNARETDRMSLLRAISFYFLCLVFTFFHSFFFF